MKVRKALPDDEAAWEETDEVARPPLRPSRRGKMIRERCAREHAAVVAYI